MSSAWGPGEGREEEEGRRADERKAITLDIFCRILVEAWYAEEGIHQRREINIAPQRHRSGKEGTTLPTLFPFPLKKGLADQ